MGFKKCIKTGLHEAYYSKRHPVTKMPVTLRRRGITTLAEAKRIERELVAQVHEKLKDRVVPRWNEAVDNYFQAMTNLGQRQNTIVGHESCLRVATSEVWKDRRVDEISTQEIRDLIKVANADKAENYQRKLHRLIRAVFKHAIECNQLQRNPVPEMKFRPGDKLKGVLTREQAKRFLETAKQLNSQWYPHWAMALYTGCRSGELYALTWDKLNLEDRMIKVDTSWNKKDGFKSTKSGDDRMVEIAPTLLTMLRELKLKSGDSKFVLPRIWQWDQGDQARELRRFLIGMGLPAIRFHDLRASWATILLQQGVEPIRVMTMGGWRDLETLMIYVRKAGVDIKGSTDNLVLHNPSQTGGTVLSLSLCS